VFPVAAQNRNTMATPIGHTLAGYVTYKLSKVSQNDQSLHLLLLSIVMANFPDLDFLPGFLAGSPALYHQGITHSMGIGLLISLAAAGVFRVTGWPFMPVFVLCFFSYLSHLIIDFLGPDGRSPYGVPLFWPITDRYFISPRPLFLGMHHAPSTEASIAEWLAGIKQPYNLLAIAVEVASLAPFLILSRAFSKKTVSTGST
jgi:inner membrane protein